MPLTLVSNWVQLGDAMKKSSESSPTGLDLALASEELAQAVRRARKAHRRLTYHVQLLQYERAALLDAGADPTASYTFKDGRYMYLRFYVGGKEQRKYIGVDPQKVQLAKERVEKGRRVLEIDAALAESEIKAQRLMFIYRDWAEQVEREAAI